VKVFQLKKNLTILSGNVLTKYFIFIYIFSILMKFHTKKHVGASTKHAQQVKCDIAFDAFVVQCPTRKKNSKVFYWTRTMINVANIFIIE